MYTTYIQCTKKHKLRLKTSQMAGDIGWSDRGRWKQNEFNTKGMLDCGMVFDVWNLKQGENTLLIDHFMHFIVAAALLRHSDRIKNTIFFVSLYFICPSLYVGYHIAWKIEDTLLDWNSSIKLKEDISNFLIKQDCQIQIMTNSPYIKQFLALKSRFWC